MTTRLFTHQQSSGNGILLCCILLLIPAGGCASQESDVAINDPFEPANRKVHDFNTSVRMNVLEPIGKAANAAGLTPVRQVATNFFSNLGAPLVALNDLSQGRPCAAGVTASRFLVNSTVGVAGLFDVAEDQLALEGHDNGFAQTLSVWGVPAGPYIVLPVLGPSNARGVVATATEAAAAVDPLAVAFPNNTATAGIDNGAGIFLAATDIDTQSALTKLENSSLDGYAALRSAHQQAEVEAIKPPECPFFKSEELAAAQ
jgi:phospholipid-binding lipoprotein MlaA